jgi:hypothetical protein
MKGKWLGVLVLVVVGGVLLSVASCGRSQELVSISVQPTVETFGSSSIPLSFDAGAQVQLRALGSYIHPPVTKDITNQVTWSSNTPQMVTVNSTGLITVTGGACGGTIISATVKTNSSSGGLSASGAIVTGSMTANVVCFTGNGGGSGNPALTLTFQGAGNGTVSSSPAGLSCTNPGPCVTQAFTSGTMVTLTAAPGAGSTTATWPSCPSSTTTNVCNVNLSGNTTVTVAFN